MSAPCFNIARTQVVRLNSTAAWRAAYPVCGCKVLNSSSKDGAPGVPSADFLMIAKTFFVLLLQAASISSFASRASSSIKKADSFAICLLSFFLRGPSLLRLSLIVSLRSTCLKGESDNSSSSTLILSSWALFCLIAMSESWICSSSSNMLPRCLRRDSSLCFFA